ncbi:hypothetical protein JTE90_013681 [Oedothorax gibbosus]|uniref:DDB1-and CUL4-associated factor 4 n=1 Tax=Oedothorax gibbosus TaxID=931172 RepID=A0AAV6VBW7_9ARAC|nr:hypothetical protein JTE90_013681 [Oedothorax gibbosus]
MDPDDDDYLRFQTRQWSLHGSESRDFVIHARSPYEKKREDAVRANKKSLQLNIQSGSVTQTTKFSLPKCLAFRETGVTNQRNFQSELLRLKLRQVRLVSSCQVDFADYVSCYYVKGYKRKLIGAWTYHEYSATMLKAVTFDYTKPDPKSKEVKSSISDVVCKDIISLPSYRVFDLCGLSYLDKDYALYVANSYSRNKNVAHISPLSQIGEYGDQQDDMVRRFEHQEILWSCSWNSYRQRFAIGADRCFYLHDYESFSKKVDLPRGQPYSLDFNGNGNMLYCGLHSGDLFCFDLRAETNKPTLTVPLCKNISYIKLLSDEQTVVVSGFNGVLLNVDLRTRKSVFQYPNHYSLYKKLTFNLNESLNVLCAPGEDNITRLWSINDGKLLHNLPLPNRDYCGQINTFFEAEGRKMYVHILLGETIHTFEVLEESVQDQKVLMIDSQPIF